MWVKLYRDPNPSDQGGAQPPAAGNEIPKTKEDWNKLRTDNPTRWADLTQSRMDQMFGENLDLKKKLDTEAQEKKNLSLELQKFQQPPVTPVVPEVTEYGQGRYPTTPQEWDDLFIERPTFATDLRNQWLSNQNVSQAEFQKTRQESVNLLAQEHPDMYFPVVDDAGKPKLDEKGKPIVQRNPTTGELAFNETSEKGKLWNQIFNEATIRQADGTLYNPYQHMKNAPLVMMAEMERRLRAKGAAMINGQNNIAETDQSGVAPQGVTPPKTGSLKFYSEEEKVHAQRAVDRGTYKDLEEYLKLRDRGEYGYAEKNSRPDFTKR